MIPHRITGRMPACKGGLTFKCRCYAVYPHSLGTPTGVFIILKVGEYLSLYGKSLYVNKAQTIQRNVAYR